MGGLLAVIAGAAQLAAAHVQLVPGAEGPGLRDGPLAGGKLQYLDGQWQARCTTAGAPTPEPRNGSCGFEANVDFDVENTSTAGMMSAKDQFDCCYKCWNRPGCAAAVRDSCCSWRWLASGQPLRRC